MVYLDCYLELGLLILVIFLLWSLVVMIASYFVFVGCRLALVALVVWRWLSALDFLNVWLGGFDCCFALVLFDVVICL